jgi:hypothetical protein
LEKYLQCLIVEITINKNWWERKKNLEKSCTAMKLRQSAELMVVLPDEPFAQLDVARKITSLALASRLGWLEAEAERLRAQLAERDSEAEDLRERVEQLDAALAVATGRLRRAEEEKVPLISFLPVEAAVLRAERYPILSTSRTTEPYQRLVAALAASQILRIIQGLRHGLAS